MAKAPVTFNEATANPEIAGIEDISPEDLQSKTAAVHLVDVRRPDEFTGELGHIAGSKLVTLETLPENMGDLPTDGTIVFVCRSGGRSARAASYAKSKGYAHVYNMKGGMLRWTQLGYPIEK